MRSIITGTVVGLVVGLVVGATVLAPSLPRPPSKAPPPEAVALPPPATPAAPPSAEAPAEPVRWRVAGAYSATLPQFGSLARRLEAQVRRLSAGRLEVHYHEPGRVVPMAEALEATAAGAVEALFAAPGHWADRSPVLHVFAGLPFGPPPAEFLAWMQSGGGRALHDAAYEGLGVHAEPCGLIPAQAGGWFRNAITAPEDLAGLSVGATSLPGRVLATAGADVHTLAGPDIFIGLESGTLDGALFASPAIDLGLGFHRLAKHAYFPGWQHQAGLVDLVVNLEAWNALGPDGREAIATACGENLAYGLAEGEALQYAALRQLQKQGAVVHRWPRRVLDALQEAWHEVAVEIEKNDPAFAEGRASLATFRKEYAIWRELGYLEPR